MPIFALKIKLLNDESKKLIKFDLNFVFLDHLFELHLINILNLNYMCSFDEVICLISSVFQSHSVISSDKT